MVPKRVGRGGSPFGSPALALHYICNNIIVLSIKKTLNSVQGPLHDRSLLFSGGICLVCSNCLPPCQCPPWHCLGSLVHFVGPFWSWPKLFGITICSVLSSLLPHLSDWQAPAVYWKILVYRDWTQIPITGFLKIFDFMCVLKLLAREEAKSH